MDRLNNIINFFREREEMSTPEISKPNEMNPTPNVPAAKSGTPTSYYPSRSNGWGHRGYYDDDDHYWGGAGVYQGAYSYSRGSSEDRTMGEVVELNEDIASEFEGRAVVVLEKLRGIGVRAIYDGKNFKFGNRLATLFDAKESFGAMDVFLRNKYALVKLAERIQTPFCLFGELIGNEINKDIPYFELKETKDIYFHDIWLNDNWMCWDDFSSLTKAVNLRTAPMIGLENFNEEVVREFAKTKSLASYLTGQDMEGVIIRPFIEDTHAGKRLVAKITNIPFIKSRPVFTPTLPAVTNNKTTNQNNADIILKGVAANILNTFCTEARFVYWKHELDTRDLKVNESNVYKILSVLVKLSIRDLLPEIETAAARSFLSKKVLVKELKRILPKRIIKSLGLSLPSKID
jgi:hypothetical protein